ncbi:MAG: hypothetical protein ACKV2Q_07520 [Planctomycetaceae bacterium]
MSIKEQIESFHRFALRVVDAGGTDLSLDDLYDLWKCDNLPADELAESVACVREALDEMQHDDAWIDVEDHLAQLRSKYRFLERP